MSGDSQESEAQASHRLRRARFAASLERLQAANAAMTQIFELLFTDPESAETEFGKLVQGCGLPKAVEFVAQPSEPGMALGWKALRADGIERSLELLPRLSKVYREWEVAQNAHDLSIRLIEDAERHEQMRGSQVPQAQTNFDARQQRTLRQT